MSGGEDGRLERRELAHRLLRPGVIPSPGGVGDADLAVRQRFQPGRVDLVDGVADEGYPIALAPEPDQARRMAREVDDLEAGHIVALGDGVIDLDRAAVPAPQQERVDP